MRDFTAVLWFVVGLYSAARGPLVLYSTTQPRTTVICLSVWPKMGHPATGVVPMFLYRFFWDRLCHFFRVLSAVRLYFYSNYCIRN